MIKLDYVQDLVDEKNKISERKLELLELKINNEIVDLDGIISIRFISDNEIKKLNRIYRKKDEVTDVLSFAYLDDKGEYENDLLGDVVISLDQAIRQSDGELKLELLDIITHGILHVLGYDHEKSEDMKLMFPLQDKIVDYVVSKKVL